MPTADPQSTKSSTHTAGGLFLDDGKLIEIVLARDEPTTQLAVGVGADVRVDESSTGPEGELLAPVPAKNNLIHHRAVLLPGPPEPYGTVEALVADIEGYVSSYVDLSPGFLRIVSAYVLLSWVYDAFNELPYLRFRGDYGSGKTRALLVIGAITYKPLFGTGASTISPIFHALDLFRGTLVVDESDFRVSDEKAELTKIMNQGNVRGFPVLRSQATPQKTFDPRAFYVFGPKIVAMRHSFSDPALESRFLTEEMGQRPLRNSIPINLPDDYEAEAYQLRCRLLSYRFDKFHSTAVRPDCYDPTLSPRANQVMIPLLSVIDDPALKEGIVSAMRSTETMLYAERATSIEGHLLEVIDFLIDATSKDVLTVGEIAEAFRTRHGVEYDRPITPRYIGHVLRNRLHLETVKRHGVFVLLTGDRSRVNALAARYGVSQASTA